MFKKYIVNIVFVFLGLITVQAQETYNTLIYKGNRNFDNKKYDRATSVFMDAVKKNENDFGAHYNLGNSFYKKKMYNQANAEYRKAQKFTKDPNEKAASLYNMGNAHMQNGEVEKAIESYKDALKNDPDNQAILKNLQIAKKQKQQNQGGQQNKQNQQNAKDQNDHNQNKGNADNQENKNKNPKGQDNGSQGKENKGKGSQGNMADKQNSNQNQENNKLPKDLQQLILQRSANQERETARNLQNRKAYSAPESNEKDW